MTNGVAILPGGNIDELRRSQDTENYSNKWLKPTVLFPAPVGPITLEDDKIERLRFYTIKQ